MTWKQKKKDPSRVNPSQKIEEVELPLGGTAKSSRLQKRESETEKAMNSKGGIVAKEETLGVMMRKMRARKGIRAGKIFNERRSQFTRKA